MTPLFVKFTYYYGHEVYININLIQQLSIYITQITFVDNFCKKA